MYALFFAAWLFSAELKRTRQRIHPVDERSLRRTAKTGIQALRSGPGRINQTRPIKTYHSDKLASILRVLPASHAVDRLPGIAGHKSSDTVIERLPSLVTLTPGGRIPYTKVVAFRSVIGEIDIVEL